MNKIMWYKNFNMGSELEICGEFIYEAAREAYAFRDFHEHFVINKILYFASAGIERLQKILLCMYLFDSEDAVNNAPDVFYQHRHMALHNLITKHIALSEMKRNHLSLLQLLQDYYNNHRYGEFDLNYSSNDLIVAFVDYYKKIKGVDINPQSFVDPCEIDSFKRLFVNYLGEIAQTYFLRIDNKATELGIFTTELTGTSNANKVFRLLEKEKLWDLISLESRALKELIIFLSRRSRKANIKKLIKCVSPLPLDGAMINEHLVDITRFKASDDLTDLVYECYSNIEPRRKAHERKKLVDLLGDPNTALD